MDNLTLWNGWKTPPKLALKPIKGGRLSGMTDISPIWRYSELTKAFGPCGSGWYYTIDKEWREEAGEEIHCYVQISLYYKVGKSDEQTLYSLPICSLGGSKILAQEKNGKHASDEAYKMALTDALSVACKMLGIGADVYWSEGSKYTECAADEPKPNKPQASSPNLFQTKINEFLEDACMTMEDFVRIRKQLIEGGALPDVPSRQLAGADMDTLFDRVRAQHFIETTDNEGA